MLTKAELDDAATTVCAALAADCLLGEVPGMTSFDNMVRALSMHSFSNTAEQSLRLKCAHWARRNRKAYLAELDRRRALRNPAKRKVQS